MDAHKRYPVLLLFGAGGLIFSRLLGSNEHRSKNFTHRPASHLRHHIIRKIDIGKSTIFDFIQESYNFRV